MAYNQAYSAYKETGVRTASQSKLIVMLYDEAVKQLTSAVNRILPDGKINPAHIDKFNFSIIKTQEIITELMVSLNMEAGGEISKNLLNLYTYFNQELLEANVSRNKDKIIFIRDMMQELRETWETVSYTESPMNPVVSAGISIDG